MQTSLFYFYFTVLAFSIHSHVFKYIFCPTIKNEFIFPSMQLENDSQSSETGEFGCSDLTHYVVIKVNARLDLLRKACLSSITFLLHYKNTMQCFLNNMKRLKKWLCTIILDHVLTPTLFTAYSYSRRILKITPRTLIYA